MAARRVKGVHLAAGAGLGDQGGKFHQPTRGAHEVDDRGAPADGGAVLLCHATQKAHDEARLAAFAGDEFADVREHSIFGVVADRARDEQQHVGRLRVVDKFGAAGAQHFSDQFGVELVHLATVGRDVDARIVHERR
jgi:hypothetical protein